MEISKLIMHLEALRKREGDIEVPPYVAEWAIDPDSEIKLDESIYDRPRFLDSNKELPRHLFPESVKVELRAKGLL